MRNVKLIIMTVVFCASFSLCAQVGINTNTPHPSSILDISSNNKGILIPRVALTDLNNGVLDGTNTAEPSLLVFNINPFISTGFGYHYFTGNRWVKLLTSDDNTIDSDWLRPNGSFSNSINDNIYTMGSVAIGSNIPSAFNSPLTVIESNGATRAVNISNSSNDSSSIFGLNVSVNKTGFGGGTGIQNFISTTSGGTGILNTVAGDGEKNGIRNTISGTSVSQTFAIFNDIIESNNQLQYGVFNRLYGSGNGPRRGIFNDINNNGTGFIRGIDNAISGNGSSEKTGVYTRFNSNNTATGNLIGVHNNFAYNGSGMQTGIFNEFSIGGTGAKIGMSTRMYSNNTSTGNLTGNSVQITSNGGLGQIVGTYTRINGSSNSVVAGNSISISNSSTGAGIKYGTLININTNQGTNYGVYSSVNGSGGISYAGYFLGDVAVGTTTANTYTLPQSVGNVGDIMQLGAGGQAYWVSPPPQAPPPAINTQMQQNIQTINSKMAQIEAENIRLKKEISQLNQKLKEVDELKKLVLELKKKSQ